ncbi:nucleotidyltransferase family protein [Polynucleobacter rarus]|jgi:type I restriction enzyme S subunit|uniref:nucleotidyltransferase family protein n=1 Tax=Polynucleobacter rarus TaxID=556055 RepID=UPI000D3E3245|nr:nucleotidyltransferase domain-containing protein [Polynucleobacter rarus]
MSKIYPPIEVSSSEWKIIEEILITFAPNQEVLAFGSRAKFLAKPYSDLDLALKGEMPLNLSSVVDLKEAFSNSDLTFKVDIVQWENISEAFREIISKNSVLIKKSR